LERINLNVPADVRKRLRAMARSRRKTESETARELLIAALELAEREAVYRSVEEAMTPELRKHLLKFHDALEKLYG
jgi:hypothetical protein